MCRRMELRTTIEEADRLRAENAMLLNALVDALGAKSFSDLKTTTVETIKAVLLDPTTASHGTARSGVSESPTLIH